MFFPLKPGEYSVKAHYRLARRVLLAVSGPHNEDRKARALSYVGHVTRRAEAASICWQGLGGGVVGGGRLRLPVAAIRDAGGTCL